MIGPQWLSGTAHRRFNPLTGDWVLVSAGRTNRPWLGGTETMPARAPEYDSACYLCPGNKRVNGEANPPYDSTYVFTNDFPALRDEPDLARFESGLLRAEAQAGTSRVVCYSPHHDRRMSLMTIPEIESIVEVWRGQTVELGRQWTWVQVFENNGEAMGASNPHPHGQIWAGSALPTVPAREDTTQRRYMQEHGVSLLVDYLNLEEEGERVVVDGEEWVALIPFWATWPFEVLVLPKRPVHRLDEVDQSACTSLATVLRELLIRYDGLFQYPFPYSMGWHGAPFGVAEDDHWQLHAHFFPPLLRSASIRKFMVGYELLAEAQRDLMPEDAAARLRAQVYDSPSTP